MKLGMWITILVLALGYGYCTWQRLRYLLWKWRVIPIFEEMDRRKKGLCIKCAYDLRGTPQRCPECGEEVQGADKAESH